MKKQTAQSVQLRYHEDPDEIHLLQEYAQLNGLKVATALKFFLRETLPGHIEHLKNQKQTRQSSMTA